jgi:hypothetical protein
MTDARADWLERIAANMQLNYPDLPIALGVGNGSGSLFVYGGDAATKTCQDKLLKLEAIENRISTETEMDIDALKQENQRLKNALKEIIDKGINKALAGCDSCPQAQLWRLGISGLCLQASASRV